MLRTLTRPLLSLHTQTRNLSANRPSKTKGTLDIRSGKSARGIIHSIKATGNNVSHSKRKTKRTFKPNVFKRRLYSEVLGSMVGPVNVSATGLRDIDKWGGLDNYILRNQNNRVRWEGEIGRIRKRVMEEVKRKGKEKRKIEEGEKGV
mmetsp:Transcript_17568/g.36394  ORF Transcript_17568/g.36394 Transcript_17568/m.36394 type:complete len:148 (+) Transcript_17568:334-777(+)